MLTYVINLDRQPARMARMAEQLAGVAFERVPAVEGRELPGPERRLGEVPRTPEEITRYELAVTLSHKEAWRRFLESGAAWCCVLEDDVCLSPDFAKFTQGTDWLPGDTSIVKIEMCGQRKRFLGAKRAVFMGRSLMPLLSIHLGAAGYIIGRSAAEFSLNRILVDPAPSTMFYLKIYFATGRSGSINWFLRSALRRGKLPARMPFRPTCKAPSKARSGSRACP